MLKIIKEVAARLFFGSKQHQEKKSIKKPPGKQNASSENDSAPKPSTSSLKLPGELEPSAEWLIKEAYEQIINNVQASERFKTTVLDTLIEFEQTGAGSRLYEQCINNNLINEEWNWPEYDNWFAVFKKADQWPFTWNKILYTEPDPAPDTIKASLPYLTVPDIKDFLKKHDLMPKPMPKNRAEWDAVLCEKGNWNQLKPMITGRHEAHKNHYLFKRNKEKLHLLFIYLIHGVYGRLRYYQTQDVMSDPVSAKIGKIKAQRSDDKLTVEKDLVEKFNNGEISNYPPFFPGCTVTIGWERIKRE